ncbi:hypothetical protein Poly30_34260 [Planctomycetes bacterium Poly30]|uniref:Uncharacterized protein n=1 Tax=Saltatorellus ferox TaxID=2528018 RepID=A0A518EUZ5_9BACT|nr:hypothetical protein Poly30_34260 [Planctomycetes bacterium Poly30]
MCPWRRTGSPCWFEPGTPRVPSAPRVRQDARAPLGPRRGLSCPREARPRGPCGEHARPARAPARRARPSGEDACAASAKRCNRYFAVRRNARDTARCYNDRAARHSMPWLQSCPLEVSRYRLPAVRAKRRTRGLRLPADGLRAVRWGARPNGRAGQRSDLPLRPETSALSPAQLALAGERSSGQPTSRQGEASAHAFDASRERQAVSIGKSVAGGSAAKASGAEPPYRCCSAQYLWHFA